MNKDFVDDYIRLQFTPPYLPFIIWGINYIPQKELANWKVTRFEMEDYASGKEKVIWEKSMKDFVSLDHIMTLKRVR